MPHKPRIASLLAFALALAFSQGPAQAQVVRPFKVTGGGFVPDGISLIPGESAFHNATGQATELGRYSGEGFFTLLGFTSQLTADFSSAPDFFFIAANGDAMIVTYVDVYNCTRKSGEVTLHPLSDGSFIAVFVAEFNPVPSKCTGRFAKVTGGSFLMVALSEPFFLLETSTTPFAYSWQGSGSLAFKQGW
jgi:hypothetical protein